MSEENVDKVRSAIEAYNARDYDTALRYFDDEATFEFAEFAAGATGAVHRGPDGVREFWADIEHHFDDFRLDASGFRSAGPTVYCEILLSGRGRGSGARIELPTHAVTELRDGRIVCIRFAQEES